MASDTDDKECNECVICFESFPICTSCSNKTCNNKNGCVIRQCQKSKYICEECMNNLYEKGTCPFCTTRYSKRIIRNIKIPKEELDKPRVYEYRQEIKGFGSLLWKWSTNGMPACSCSYHQSMVKKRFLGLFVSPKFEDDEKPSWISYTLSTRKFGARWSTDKDGNLTKDTGWQWLIPVRAKDDCMKSGIYDIHDIIPEIRISF